MKLYMYMYIYINYGDSQHVNYYCFVSKCEVFDIVYWCKLLLENVYFFYWTILLVELKTQCVG